MQHLGIAPPLTLPLTLHKAMVDDGPVYILDIFHRQQNRRKRWKEKQQGSRVVLVQVLQGVLSPQLSEGRRHGTGTGEELFVLHVSAWVHSARRDIFLRD